MEYILFFMKFYTEINIFLMLNSKFKRNFTPEKPRYNFNITEKTNTELRYKIKGIDKN